MAMGPETGPAPVILLVEDDEQVRGLARTLLAGEGYEVIEARTGTEALARAAGVERRIDVILSDMLLPELSGYDVARQIKDVNPQVQVVLMTGYVEGDIVQKCVSDLDASFLDKPFTAARLRALIRQLTDSTKNAAARNSDLHRES